MFFAQRPSREAIDRFVRDSQDLPISYGPIGIVNGETPCRDLDEATVTIGRGRTDFERARTALTAWKQFDIGWVEVVPRHTPVEVGTVVAVLIRHLGFWSLNGCRVLYTVGGDGRFGFAYGTLTNHAESGEAPVVHNFAFPDASANPVMNPVHTFHLGLWFNSPVDAGKAGCPTGVTPFNGDHDAGVQVLNTGQFDDAQGPLGRLKP